MSLKEAGLMWVWSLLGIFALIWIYVGIKA